MKILVSNYTFDASEKKITFTDYNPIVVERVLLVTNVTDGIIIYNFADPTKGGTAATNVLTLAYDTTSMSDTDKLQIFYDDVAATQPISGTVIANAGTNLNTSALATSAKQDTQDTSINSLLKPASTLAAVTTVGTITNVVHVDDNAGSLTVDGSVTANAGTNLNTSALALETGGNLASIKTNTDKIPALGQALAAASVPVILPAATITTLTPPAAITGFALETGGNLATIAGKDFATQTTLAAINSKMVTGTDIGDVTINNAGGAAAVNIQDGGNAITVDGTVTANLGAVDNAVLDQIELNQDSQTAILTTIDADTGGILTAVQLLDNAVDGNYLNTNLNVAGTDVAGGNGVTNAQTLRVTVSSDSTGVLSVDDNGGSLTVDGTVTANLSATDNAVLDSIDASSASKYITGIGHGVKVVTTAGTDVALATSTACKRVTIQAQTDNTNVIAVGGSGVDATLATGTGIVLYPGDVFEMDIDNLSDIYIDSLVNGEGVRFTYFT